MVAEPEWELTRLWDLCCPRGTPAGLGSSGEKASTHLEEIRRHLLLRQMALDVLDGAFREGLGKTEVCSFSTGPSLPSPRPCQHAGPGTHV